ncbi:MAG: ribosome assembly RNA-binding protein YhbY [Sandaracinaceae bacterium]|jgi:RNA-binding protein|nr:ribosome assembly RNA-binding protein YhbY [Sandaracinaceae bacterium]
MKPLTGKQQRHLKALAHALEPVVILGKDGVSEGVLTATDQALVDHELIKVKLPDLDRDERAVLAVRLAEGTEAALVGTIGRVAILYRRHPSEPKVALPQR